VPPATPPRSVFLSHTSEIARHPAGRTFLDGAVRAVNRAAWAPVDMSWWTAESRDAARLCRDKVTASDVYVGIIGFRYGSPVPGVPDSSYVGLEFDAATEAGLPRLLFFLAEELTVPVPAELFGGVPDPRQHRFRAALRDSRLVLATVDSPLDLELKLYQALVQLQFLDRMAGLSRPRKGAATWLERALLVALGAGAIIVAEDLPDPDSA
jgi:hypothetical protein